MQVDELNGALNHIRVKIRTTFMNFPNAFALFFRRLFRLENVKSGILFNVMYFESFCYPFK